MSATLAVVLTAVVPQLRSSPLPGLVALGTVVVLALEFGATPGIVAAVVSAIGLQALVIHAEPWPYRLAQMLAFLTVGAASSWVIGGWRDAREALRRSRDQYLIEQRNLERRSLALIENSADAVTLFDRAGVILYASPAATEILGYETADFVGRNAFDLIHADDRAGVVARLGNLTQHGRAVSADARMRHQDGSWRWLEGTFRSLVNDPAVRAIVANYRDVTERRRAEQAMRDLESRIEFALLGVGAGIWELDLGQRRVEWAIGVDEVLGLAPGTLDGSLDAFFAAVHPDDRARLRRATDAAVASRGTLEVEFRAHGADGKLRWIEVKGQVLLDAAQQPSRILGINVNVTARKLLEEQFHQAQKMEAVGLLAGGVAHDFNNLLTVIVGYSELLEDRVAPDDPLQKELAEIRKAGESATALTRQLLAFSRKDVAKPAILDVNAVLTRLDKMLRRLIGERVELVSRLEPGLDAVSADAGQIEQVVLNLAVNARDAMPNGGRLTIATGNVTLDSAYEATHLHIVSGRYVMIAVSDTGVGMTPEIQARIFEPFFTTKEPGRGTGLGLSTVFGIVRQSGGGVWVYSEPGRGTTFKIYLPIAGESVGTAVDAPAALALRGRETVLVVEDSAPVRRIAATALRQYGYTVIEAGGPAEATAIWERDGHAVDLLLADLVMPGMSGRALADLLSARRPALRRLYMSGYTADVIAQQEIAGSQVPYVQKPFTPQGLARAVRQALDG